VTPGTVFWFTGLSGSGKTTLASLFCSRLRAAGRVVVFLDGDRLRQVFGNEVGHTEADRRASAMRNARLCELLSSQGFDVVCATISLFHSCHEWNRRNIPSYREVLIRAPLSVLRDRDPHGLYRAIDQGEIRDVVGVDLPAELPQSPDVSIDNDGSHPPGEIVDVIWRHLNLP
jgi:adenylylsulfate kinase-like enzyme